MTGFVAVYDACVLYPAPLRDLLMHLALSGLFRARWSNQIHDEWIEAVLRQRPDLTREQLQWTRGQMDMAVPDCLVTGYEGLVPTLRLPDPDDRHVLAAAIRAGAGAIVTYNLRDFPDDVLAPHGMGAQHPDQFIEHAFDLNPVAVCKAVRDHRLSLRNPPRSVDELLDVYQNQGLAITVAALRPHSETL